MLYGPDLFHEIERYALAGGIVASKVKFDVIHCHDWMTTRAAMVAKKVSGAPMVYHVHSIESDRSPFDNPQVAQMEYEGMMAADCIMCVSHYTKSRVMKIYSIPERKIVVVHNGIDLGNCATPKVRTSRNKRLQQVLFLGRVTWQKGPDYFAETARLMLEKKRDLKFLIAGWGDKAIPLIEQVARWNLGEKVLFAGFLNEADVKRVLHTSDLFMMPSLSEPFGLVGLEALSQGVPAVFSKQSGISEVLTSVPSVDYWDTEKFAKIGLQLLDSPEMGQKQISDIWPKLEHMNWDNNGRKILGHYKTLVRQ